MDALFKGQKKIVKYMYCMYITALSSDKLHNPLSTGNVKWPNNTELGIWDFRSENGANFLKKCLNYRYITCYKKMSRKHICFL